MKLDLKYKKVNPEGRNAGFFKSVKEKPCIICNDETLWSDPHWMKPICSDECYSALWREWDLSIRGQR